MKWKTANISELNRQLFGYVKEFSRDFDPQHVQAPSVLEVTEHYTIVAPLPSTLKIRINGFAKDLHKIDSSLLLVSPRLYHITIFYCPLTSNIERMWLLMKEYIKGEKLLFSLKGLVINKLGVALAAYTKNQDFISLRRQLSILAGSKSIENDRTLMSWITIARYTQKPKTEVKEYVLSHLDDKLGVLKINQAALLKNSRRDLLRAVRLKTVKS